jgi:hypothetical protein
MVVWVRAVVLPSPVPGNRSGRPFTEYRFLIHKRTKFNGFALEYIGKIMEYWRQNKRGELLPRKINIQTIIQGGT